MSRFPDPGRPRYLMGTKVWVRGTDTHIIFVHIDAARPVEVTRHTVTRPGTLSVNDAHFPPDSAGALESVIRAKSRAEEEFLVLGAGAALWLKEATAAGTNRIRHKMERAVTLSKVLGGDVVDQGLGAAAVHHRFTQEDLVSILPPAKHRWYPDRTAMP